MRGMRSNALRVPVAGAAFLALADTAIVALALPPILRELDTDVAGVAAVLGVYAVVLALALPLAERLRELVGTRPVGLAGVALFAGGSLACGIADSLDLLLLARAVQALGGGALLVTAYALLAGRDGDQGMSPVRSSGAWPPCSALPRVLPSAARSRRPSAGARSSSSRRPRCWWRSLPCWGR